MTKRRPPFWATEIRPDKIKRNCRIGRHVPACIYKDYITNEFDLVSSVLCQNCGKELEYDNYAKFWGRLP